MNIFIFIIGFLAGLFLWSSIIGTLLFTLPTAIKLKFNKRIAKIKWLQITVPLIFAASILGVGYSLSQYFAWGASFAALVMLFNVRNLKNEGSELINRQYSFENNKKYIKPASTDTRH